MIYYFSGTGNTRWVAKTLATALHCEAIDICSQDFDSLNHKALFGSMAKDEAVGFAFPIHGWQPPRFVRRFLRSLPHSIFTDRYVFAVCTCGDETGLALDVFAGELKRRGTRLNMCASVQMPNTYVCLPFMDTDGKDVETRKLEEARKTVAQIAERITNHDNGEFLTKGGAPWLLTHVVGEYFNRRMVNDRKFRVDSSKCVHCGKCQEVCPVGNIVNSNTADTFTPDWKHDDSCTGCLACYHNCPRHAISFGAITNRRGQYFFKD